LGQALREITDEDELLLASLVEQGLAFLEVRKRMPDLRLHGLRTMYTQYQRAVRSGKLKPIPEDFQKRKEWVQAQWMEGEWGKRWVGRYAQKRDTDLHQAASKMLQ
jgi:hypothetical protein